MKLRTLFVSVIGSLLFHTALSAATFSVTDNNDILEFVDGGSGLRLGEVTWNVSEPYINLWLMARPLSYQPSRGPVADLNLTFKQRGTRPFDAEPALKPRIFSVGTGWNFSWLSCIVYTDPGATATVHFDGGGSRLFTADGAAVDYITHTKLSRTLSGNVVTSFERLHPSGAKEVFSFIFAGSTAKYAFRTAIIDPFGFALNFNYTTYTDGGGNLNLRLNSVTDIDGRTTTFQYTNGSFPNYVTRVTDPFGRFANFAYDASGRLQTITDTGGLNSSYAYNANNIVSSMTTVYGTTSLAICTTPTGAVADGRWVKVTEADGNNQLFLYKDNLTAVFPTSYPSGEVPVTSPYANMFDNSLMYDRNSFHWDRKQYTALSAPFTGNVSSLTSSDYGKAHLKHWLKETPSGSYVYEVLSMERTGSPDGIASGQKIWYDYSGKPSADTVGTQSLPLFVALVRPDGTSRFTQFTRNSWGKTTQEISTYTPPSGPVTTRTFTLTYAADGINLLEERGPSSQLLRSYTYNSNRQMLTRNDVVDGVTTYTTTFTYDPTYRQLTSIARASGLTTSFTYNTDRRISQIADQPINRLNSFTYFANGLPQTHTDPLGLTRTLTFDNLQRLTRVDFPGGTYTSRSYTKADLTPSLDVTSIRDRLGFIRSFEYDPIGIMTKITDPLTQSFTMGCECGEVKTITDPLTKRTLFTRNNDNRITQATYADTSDPRSVGYAYNALGQLTSVKDHSGNTVETYTYNNQGLLATVSNPIGQVKSIAYDIYDRPVTITPVGGPTVTQTFDLLGRVLTRSYSGGGTETFAYSARGLISHTDQLNHTTTHTLDEAGRPTAVTNAKNEITRFTYRLDGQIATVTDGKNQVTTFNYDTEGRLTSKVDASGTILTLAYDANRRVTSRTTPAKGTTSYTYDSDDRLTFINHPTSADVTLNYDTLDRISSVSDSVTGTTSFTYTDYGTLKTEDGPWASDTVTYTYNNNRQRNALTVTQPFGTWPQAYTYDSALRLQYISSPAGTFGYTYQGASALITGLSLPNRANIANTYDTLARLTSTILRNNGGSTLNSHGYSYDNANRRTQQTRTGNYVNYTYDVIDQLTGVTGYETPSGTQRKHENLTFAYDAAGNLTQRNNNALVETFTFGNSLNQPTSATTSGTLTVAGMTTGGATSVTVNSSSATPYSDGSYAVQGLALTSSYTASTTLGGETATDIISLPWASPISFSHDSNGNLTGDSRRIFTYDDENRLTRVEVVGVWRTDFAYDGLGRRRWKKEYNGAGGLLSEVRYVYDGALVIEERDGNNNPLVTYARGLDLSGSLSGAGGIGGLLARSDANGIAYYHSDGSGNVTMLTDSNQTPVAKYIYDPFGNLLGMSGPLADANTYRFSSKEYHVNSGLYDFGARFYDPNLQRWTGRDPAGLVDGPNLYAYVRNGPINAFDPWGLDMMTLTFSQQTANRYGVSYLPAGIMRHLINLATWRTILQPTT